MKINFLLSVDVLATCELINWQKKNLGHLPYFLGLKYLMWRMGQNLIKKLDSPSHCVQSFLNFANQFQILILKGLGNMKKKCNSVYRTKIFSKLPTFFRVVFTQTTHTSTYTHTYGYHTWQTLKRRTMMVKIREKTQEIWYQM